MGENIIQKYSVIIEMSARMLIALVVLNVSSSANMSAFPMTIATILVALWISLPFYNKKPE